MYLFDCFFLFRVLVPSRLPQGVTGGRPPEAFPSPPPKGWSTGFIATPRTLGRRPRQRLAPAFPIVWRLCPILPTWPIVAIQVFRTCRTSMEGNLRATYLPSLATTCTPDPAERANCPPLPGLSSILCTMVPNGILSNGNALPIWISDSGPAMISVPT